MCLLMWNHEIYESRHQSSMNIGLHTYSIYWICGFSIQNRESRPPLSLKIANLKGSSNRELVELASTPVVIKLILTTVWYPPSCGARLFK